MLSTKEELRISAFENAYIGFSQTKRVIPQFMESPFHGMFRTSLIGSFRVFEPQRMPLIPTADTSPRQFERSMFCTVSSFRLIRNSQSSYLMFFDCDPIAEKL